MLQIQSQNAVEMPQNSLNFGVLQQNLLFYDHLWIFVEEKMMVTSLADNQKFCQFKYVPCCTIIPLKSDARLDVSGVLLMTTMYACYGPAFAGEEQVFQDQWSRKSE